jgi:hypothetical protein
MSKKEKRRVAIGMVNELSPEGKEYFDSLTERSLAIRNEGHNRLIEAIKYNERLNRLTQEGMKRLGALKAKQEVQDE